MIRRLRWTAREVAAVLAYAGSGLLADVRMGASFEVAVNGRPAAVAWLEALASSGWWAVRAIACCFVGHEWEDRSSAGPESGDMAMECRRCGYYFRHILY